MKRIAQWAILFLLKAYRSVRYKVIFILSLLFIIVLYTVFLWVDEINFIGLLLVTAVLIISFLCLIACLIWHVALGVKDRFKDVQRNAVILFLIVIVGVAYFQPFGLITPNRLDGKDVFAAQREGSANCMSYFKLKESNRFVDETICFGIDRIEGEYRVKNDTIYFQHVELEPNETYYKFAVIRRTAESAYDSGTVTMYKNAADANPLALWIVKNDLH